MADTNEVKNPSSSSKIFSGSAYPSKDSSSKLCQILGSSDRAGPCTTSMPQRGFVKASFEYVCMYRPGNCCEDWGSRGSRGLSALWAGFFIDGALEALAEKS